MNVYNWISASITEGTLKWSRRAANTVLQFKYNALVYIMGQKDDQETDDFVASVVAEASQIIRYKYEGFVAVIAPYDDIGLPKHLPQLSLLVGAD